MGLWSKAKKIGKKVKGGVGKVASAVEDAGDKVKGGVSKVVNVAENAGDKVNAVTNALAENSISSTLIDAGGAVFGVPDASGKLKKAGSAIESSTDVIKAGKDALNDVMSKADYVSKVAQNVPKDYKSTLEEIQAKVEKQYSSYTRNWDFEEMPSNLKKYDFNKMWS